MGFKIPVQEYVERMQVPEGRWPFILADVIDIGEVPTEWDSTKKEDSLVMVFACFVMDEDLPDDGPMLFEQRYKKSMFLGGTKKSGEIVNPSNLYKHMTEWRDKHIDVTDFDPTKEIGKPGWINIYHTNGYARLDANRALEPYTDSAGNLIPKEDWPVLKGYKQPDQKWREKPRAKRDTKPEAQAPAKTATSTNTDNDVIPF